MTNFFCKFVISAYMEIEEIRNQTLYHKQLRDTVS